MAKKLNIQCGLCDARKLDPEIYAHYEAIGLSCAALLVTPASKAAMSRLPITLNCANVVEVGEDVTVRTANGRLTIGSADAVPGEKYFLMVNGALTLEDGAQKHLAMCAGMQVNGSLTCPEGIYAGLTGVRVNGAVNCYPEGAVVLKRNAVIDRLFTLRAKNRLYWSAKRMILVDPELDPAALKAKGAFFRTGEAVVAQSKVEGLVDLIDEQTEITVVPDGVTVVTDDVTLDSAAFRRWGKKLYVIGGVTVPEDGGALANVEYLKVCGDARVPEKHRDRLLDVARIDGQVRILRSRRAAIEDLPSVKVTRWMLEQPGGVRVEDCDIVTLAPDIPKELILENLRITNCKAVLCAEDQTDALSMVCEDVDHIGPEAPKPEDGETQRIQAAGYVM